MTHDFLPKDTSFSKKRTLRLGEKLLMLDKPLVMGILNISPESFYQEKVNENLSPQYRMLAVAAQLVPYCDVLDVGAVSSRPGAPPIPPEVETDRLQAAFPLLKNAFPQALFSVDTYRAAAAEKAVELGACMVNDISGGTLDDNMFATVGRLQLPYVLSHIQGNPENMQNNPHYEDIIKEVMMYFAHKIPLLYAAGVKDIILDPGFGFGKTIDHNFHILKHIEEFHIFGLPLMAGLSRKSMIQKSLDCKPEDALNGTTVLNTLALLQGVDILRVHDAKEAREAINLVNRFQSA